jgi:hypothetical protein
MLNYFIFFSAIFAIPAQAVVVINDTTITAIRPAEEIGSNIYDFDVNNDGQIDWSIDARLSRFGWDGINALAVSTTGFVYQTPTLGDQPRVYPLEAGTLIGGSLEKPTHSWYYGFGPSLSSFSNGQTFGSFYLKEGYLGFEFEAEDSIHYGFAYLQSLGTGSMRISQVAWETEPGKAIRAGNIPEPSSFLLLSVSICMALAQRRRI